MRVLIACEYSGVERDAFIAAGHDAMSCDLLPTDRPGPHYQGDVRDVLGDGWDLMIAHPPCTDLTVAGARWFAEKGEARLSEAVDFFAELMAAPVPLIAAENPVGILSTRYRKPDQIVQPWMHGHPERKPICLWLKGIPPLKPTNVLPGPHPSLVHKMGPSPLRWKLRSKSYSGIAAAMAEQWGAIPWREQLTVW